MPSMRNALAACAVLSALLLAASLPAQQAVPPLTARVTDLTGTLDATRLAALEQTLADFEARKGSQIAVLMLPSTVPESIEAYALRVADAWQLGRSGVDDGILLLIAKNDRSLRIEVGYGLEGAVPDALANRIIDEQIVPHFYQDDYAGGVEAGIDALIRLVDGEELPAPTGRGSGADEDAWGMLPFLIFAAFVFAPVFRRAFGKLLGAATLGASAGLIAWLIAGVLTLSLVVGASVFVIAFGGTGGPGRWSSGGRPWGSGGFGGGFRGGGGRFGGGGASGRW